MMLDNPFPAPSLSKLNHISVYFIQISTKITCKQLINVFLSKKALFFLSYPRCLGRSVNFNITERFLLRRPVFPDYLSVSCDYAWTNLGCGVQFYKVSPRIRGKLLLQNSKAHFYFLFHFYILPQFCFS